MAESPSHKFGQIIGNLLEEIIDSILTHFCEQKGLYLDRKGQRGKARRGSKVTWKDRCVLRIQVIATTRHGFPLSRE